MDREEAEVARGRNAEYIERLSRELSRLASDSDLPMLAYLLSMAAEEAALARGLASPTATAMTAVGPRRPRALP
jgi:hypothetical protein